MVTLYTRKIITRERLVKPKNFMAQIDVSAETQDPYSMVRPIISVEILFYLRSP